MLDYYALGFIYNKGHLNISTGEFRVQSKDEAPLKILKRCLEGGSISGHYVYRLYSVEKARYIGNNKIKELCFVPEACRPSFVLGYFDAHGCVYKRDSKYLQVCITGPPRLMYNMQDLLIFHGIESIVKPGKKLMQLVISKQDSIRGFRSFIYTSPVRGVERKRKLLFSV